MKRSHYTSDFTVNYKQMENPSMVELYVSHIANYPMNSFIVPVVPKTV